MKIAVAFASVLTGVSASSLNARKLNPRVLDPRGTNDHGQIRLAYHGAEGMMVSWNTHDQVNGPKVQWGTSKDKLTNTASSNISITYPTSTTYNNHVLLEGLEPDTTYYYLPSPLPQGQHVEPYTLKTSRLVGDDKEFSVAVTIDLGTMGRLGLTTTAGAGVSPNNILEPGEKNTIDSLASTKSGWDFLWHPGDIAYADYWLKEQIQGFLPKVSISEGYKVYEAILNDFFDEMTAVTESKPYMVGPGNHEANCDNGGTTDKTNNITYDASICSPGQTNFTGYKNHFRMPSKPSGGTGNFWYSWNHGMTHFIQLDTETDLGHGFIAPDEIGGSEGEGASPVNTSMNAQADWLAADLAAVDRSKTPWIVVAGHRPWYLSHKNSTGTICWTCKDVFEPLLIKHKVDLVLSGHAHVYERQAPLADGKIDPNELNNPSAPWYITNGAAGHYDGLDELQVPRQKYSRFSLDTSNATYGWSRLTFHNCTHMTHEYIASKNNSILDAATLFKDRKCSLSQDSHGNHSMVTLTATAIETEPCATGSGSVKTSAPVIVPTEEPCPTGTNGGSYPGSSSPGSSKPTSGPSSSDNNGNNGNNVGNTGNSGDSDSNGNSGNNGSPSDTGKGPQGTAPATVVGSAGVTSMSSMALFAAMAGMFLMY